jgi:hypothetical protein
LRDAQPQLDAATARFTRYFGVVPGPVAVIYLPAALAALDVSDFIARGVRPLPMVAPAPALALTSAPATEGALAHEACHQFLIDYVDHRTSVTSASMQHGDGYGHPAIADWFDEAAATLCEDDAQLRRRADELMLRITDRIPLAELFAMRHPMASSVPRALATADSPALDSAARSGHMEVRDRPSRCSSPIGPDRPACVRWRMRLRPASRPRTRSRRSTAFRTMSPHSSGNGSIGCDSALGSRRIESRTHRLSGPARELATRTHHGGARSNIHPIDKVVMRSERIGPVVTVFRKS